MLAIPPALLDALDLATDRTVELSVDAGRLVVEPENRRRYSLDELLAQCDAKARRPAEDHRWVTGNPTGRELL
jgi:antitoxin ChpS